MSQQIKSDYLRALQTHDTVEAQVKKYLQNHTEYKKAIAIGNRVDPDSPEALHAISIVCVIEGAINEQYKMQTIRAHLKQCEDRLLSAVRTHAAKITTFPDEVRKIFQDADQYQKGIRMVRTRTVMLQTALLLNW